MAETERLREFWRFVVERHEIFIRRHIEKRPSPWTDDPILQRGRFTNIYRELDRATRWLAQYVLPGGPFAPPLAPMDRAFNVLVYRRFCVYETFVAIGGPKPLAQWRWAQVRAALKEREATGAQIFTGAFMLTNAGARMPKRELVADHLEQSAMAWPAMWAGLGCYVDLRGPHADLVKLPGMGGFLAYELLIDLCQGALLPYSLDSWLYVGPGARRGAELLAGRPLPGDHAAAFVEALRARQNEMMLEANVRLRGPRLTLENIEQALCEYQKYVRLKMSGRIKRLFKAPNPFEPWLWQGIPPKFMEAAR